MKGARLFGWAATCLGIAGAFWLVTRERGEAPRVLPVQSLPLHASEEGRLLDAGTPLGRSPLVAGETAVHGSDPASPDFPWMDATGIGIPQSREDLERMIVWMRGLGEEELLLLSNAGYGFVESELVTMFQDLKGSWVVPALGDLAVDEGNPLIKAVLVEGLVGGLTKDRLEDERLLPVLDSLMAQLSPGLEDRFDVGSGVVFAGWAACVTQEQDYALFAAPFLEASDNPMFVITGYDLMGMCPGAEPLLGMMVTEHPNADGRMGALEGLREAGLDGRIPPEEVTALGLAALEAETSERNRLLLYEMVLAAGGEAGQQAIEEIVRSGETADLVKTAEMLAMRMESARAFELFQDALAAEDLDQEERRTLYRALGLVDGDEGVGFLLDVAGNPELDEQERLDGLQGLRHRELDERLTDELRAMLENGDGPGQLRREALRTLVHGSEGNSGIDLRELGSLDEDPAIRAEAIALAAAEPSEDTREWLEQRLLEDDSPDVKAAAMGGLVLHAHYAGDGDQVGDYLREARRFVDDDETLAMIEKAETMVRDHDPRRLDLGLAREAKFWADVSRYTSGDARRSFERRGRRLEQFVAALRAPTR